jgi:hypothetical protein
MDTMTLYKGAALVGTWWNVVHLRNEDWQLGKTKQKKPVCAVCVFDFVVVTSFLSYTPNTIVKSIIM